MRDQPELDLSLAPPIQTRVQPLEPVWAPYFASSRGPVTVNDSLLLDNDVAIGVARSLMTPRDLRILGMRDDNRIVNDVVAMGVQSATCIANVGHRLIAKTHEVQFLKAQLTAEQKLVYEYQRDNRRLKKDKTEREEKHRHQLEILRAENEKHRSQMITFYSKEMPKRQEASERPSKRKREDHNSSFAEAKRMIFGSSSDEHQEAVRENLGEEIHSAKLKAPIVQI
ncbi:hypothetical protein ACE6H2_015521 [Prunus campanulata]